MVTSFEKVLAGRQAVEAYRTTHAKLYTKPWHKGIPSEHTPLLNVLLDELKKLGFSSLDEIFDANEQFNTQQPDRMWE